MNKYQFKAENIYHAINFLLDAKVVSYFISHKSIVGEISDEVTVTFESDEDLYYYLEIADKNYYLHSIRQIISKIQ